MRGPGTQPENTILTIVGNGESWPRSWISRWGGIDGRLTSAVQSFSESLAAFLVDGLAADDLATEAIQGCVRVYWKVSNHSIFGCVLTIILQWMSMGTHRSAQSLVPCFNAVMYVHPDLSRNIAVAHPPSLGE